MPLSSRYSNGLSGWIVWSYGINPKAVIAETFFLSVGSTLYTLPMLIACKSMRTNIQLGISIHALMHLFASWKLYRQYFHCLT